MCWVLNFIFRFVNFIVPHGNSFMVGSILMESVKNYSAEILSFWLTIFIVLDSKFYRARFRSKVFGNIQNTKLSDEL